ncbi:hypothetical protein OIDMADRAFT_46112 [Oidiodendron maius Zn]|uniref:Methyltransferase type 12 domain-containing protein n=1 Tax=Oidiodendron maius (strain Zn) TaxID=913774 RepID=A0A0C3GQU1_OIDMZ|nr:hypothetical protein OIDMADRAFT_46112 [Oidiodendron maius Zn]
MSNGNSSNEYILGRGISESVRLYGQHLLWKLHQGYLLHPSITRTENMKIADIGSGTGLWLLDLARDLPCTAQLDGYDVSNKQFPPRHLWPENVTLALLDSFDNPPLSLVGQYDVVHLRMWASNLRTKDVRSLIYNVKKLLKPGGYIQWEDADLLHQVVRTNLAEAFEREINVLFESVGLDYSWVHSLPRSLAEEHLTIVQCTCDTFEHILVQLCTDTYLLALKEILEGIKRMSSHNIGDYSTCPSEVALDQLLASHNNDLVYNWGPIVVLAQNDNTQ